METESDTSQIPDLRPVHKGQAFDIHLTAYDAYKNLPIIFKVTGVKALVNGKEAQDKTRFLPRKPKGQFCTVQVIALQNGYMEWETEIDFEELEKDLEKYFKNVLDYAVEKYKEAKRLHDEATESGAVGENFVRFQENHEMAGEAVKRAREAYNNVGKIARAASFDRTMAVIRDSSPGIMKDKTTLIYRVEPKIIGTDVLEHLFKHLGWKQNEEGEYVHEEIVPAEPIARPAPTGMLDERSSPMDEELQRLTEGVPPSPMELALAELTEDVPEPAPLPAPEPEPEPEKKSELVLSHLEVASNSVAWENGPFPRPTTKDPWAKPPIVVEASEPREPIHAEEDVTVEPVDASVLEVTDEDFDNAEPIEAAPVDPPAQSESADEKGDEADEIDEAIVKGVREKTVPDRIDEPFVEPAFIKGTRQSSPAPGSVGWRETASPAQKFLYRPKRILSQTKRFLSQTKWMSAVIVILLLAVILYKRGPDWLESTKTAIASTGNKADAVVQDATDWTKRTYASAGNKATTVAQDAKETITKATDWTKRSYDSASDKAKAEWKDAREKVVEATAKKPEPTPMPTVAPPEPTIVAEAPEPPPDNIPIVPLPMPELKPTPQPKAVAQAEPTPAPTSKKCWLLVSDRGMPLVDEHEHYVLECDDGQKYVANTTIWLDRDRLQHTDLKPFRS